MKRVEEDGPVFHRLNITENIVGVPKVFYLKINISKMYPKAVVPNLFVTAEGSMHDKFTAARKYFIMVALFFTSRNEVTSMNH